MLWLITKSAYVIYEWSPRKQPTPLSRQQATVGPCLAELDPAVAQASQHRLQNMSDQDFSNFTNLLSPFRRQIRPNQQTGSIRRSQYGYRQSTIYYAGLFGRMDKQIVDQESDVPSIIFI